MTIPAAVDVLSLGILLGLKVSWSSEFIDCTWCAATTLVSCSMIQVSQTPLMACANCKLRTLCSGTGMLGTCTHLCCCKAISMVMLETMAALLQLQSYLHTTCCCLRCIWKWNRSSAVCAHKKGGCFDWLDAEHTSNARLRLLESACVEVCGAAGLADRALPKLPSCCPWRYVLLIGTACNPL